MTHPGEIDDKPTEDDMRKAVTLLVSAVADGMIRGHRGDGQAVADRIAAAIAEARATGYAMGWNDGSAEATARSW